MNFLSTLSAHLIIKTQQQPCLMDWKKCISILSVCSCPLGTLHLCGLGVLINSIWHALYTCLDSTPHTVPLYTNYRKLYNLYTIRCQTAFLASSHCKINFTEKARCLCEHVIWLFCVPGSLWSSPPDVRKQRIWPPWYLSGKLPNKVFVWDSRLGAPRDCSWPP